MKIHVTVYLHNILKQQCSHSIALTYSRGFEGVNNDDTCAAYLLSTVYIFRKLRIVDQIAYPAKNASATTT